MLSATRSLRAMVMCLAFGSAGAVVLPTAVLAQEGGHPAPASPAADYIRVVDDDAGARVKLETSARTFKPVRGDGPVVHLVGVMHMGDQAYYDALQGFLDGQDVVLYEGVKPSGVEAGAGAKDDEARATLTAQRLRLLATLLERHRTKGGMYPRTMEELIGSLPRTHARIAQGAVTDGWGHPIVLEISETPAAEPGKPAGATFDLVSWGADGAPGGEGAAKDVRFSDQKPLSKAERESSQDGIQVQLARALGLKFQLLAVNYDRPKWRNSDLSVDVVQRKLAESGQSGDALFKMLDGSSWTAKLAGFALKLIESSKQGQAMAKLMMVEMLSRADELMSSRAAGGVGAMMKVIVIDRNDAVLDDLKKIIAEEKGVRSVALFYGSGHIPDMEKRLTGEMGYAFDGERWFTGIDMKLKDAGLDAAQAAQTRRMIRQSIEQQLGGKGRKPAPGAKPGAQDGD